MAEYPSDCTYKPKQHILFRINTINDYKISILLYLVYVKRIIQQNIGYISDFSIKVAIYTSHTYEISNRAI